MRPAISVILVILWLVAVNASDQVLSLVTSSAFEMRLSPTFEELDVAATTKVEHAIKTALLMSASGTSNFDSVYDIDIVLQQIEWKPEAEEAPLTIVRFKVHMTFFKEELASSPPSQFSLDSLIARTFSQPSTKSSFLEELGASNEPLLVGTEDVEIDLVDAPPDGDLKANEGRSLSMLDVILIVASTSIFFAILYVIYQQRQDGFDLEEQQRRNLCALDQRRKGSSRNQVGNTNEDFGSPKKTKSSQGDDVSDKEVVKENPSSNVRATTNSPNESKCPSRSIVDQAKLEGACDSEAAASPPISPCSSMPSSPTTSSRSATSPCSSMPSSPITSSRSTSWLLGAPPPNYPTNSVSSSPTSESSHLTARLLLLPMLNAWESNLIPFGSSASAPGILVESKRASSSTKYSNIDDKSFISARSLSHVPESDLNPLKSSASAPGIMVDLRRTPSSAKHAKSDDRSLRSTRSLSSIPETRRLEVETSISRSSSTITDLAVSSEHSMVTDDHQFKNNWLESKRRAFEDEEDDSVEDFFQIDVEAQSSIEDNRSRTSEFSAVSEWMKSVRVVGYPSDTRTSDMTLSSAEHSSVEPKSAQIKENNSVDCSLERSMATSLVEV
jgi:hypothetical protein